MSRSTTWNPKSYAQNARFVSELAEPLLRLLDPKPGEVILDLGCGDGSSMTFGPGDVFLAEDVTGQGHTAKPKDWVRAFIYLENEA
jgi:cyclopropane fatty-acyl-phospholipid synthase-like methyltransferase